MNGKAFVSFSLIILAACSNAGAQDPQAASSSSRCAQSVIQRKSVDWAQFHFDACHAGYNPYEVLLGPANVGKLVVAWQAGPDNISSSPVIADGVLYYGTTNNGAVYARDARTGRGLWATPTMEEGSAATPAVAEGKVYVAVGTLFSGSEIVALNAASGEPLWRRGNTGYSLSVTVAGHVYEKGSYQGLPPHTELHALDANTGDLLWRYFAFLANNFTPSIAGGLVYDGCESGNDSALCALDADTGVLRWDYNTPDSLPFFAPSVSNGLVYVGASHERVRDLFSTNMYALDAASGMPLWQTPITAQPLSTESLPFQSIPAVANDVVYVPTYEPYSSEHGYIHAIDTRTGAHLWNFQTAGPVNSSPAVANGVVYFGSDDMNIYAVDASTGSLLWKYTAAGPVSSPAVVNGMLYAADDKYVYAFHLPN